MNGERQSMNIEIQDPELEAKILAHAQARGISVEAFIASLIEGVNGDVSEDADPRIAAMRDSMNGESFLADLESMAEDVPPLPRDFSREDIYFPKD
jgi:hypothetical protein